jgi:hypothetical protein
MDTDYLTSIAECLPSKVSNSRFRVLKNVSAQTLSQQFPWTLLQAVDRKISMNYKQEGANDGEKGHGAA